ncbi:hypothetical protein ACOSQ3_028678 [Xanthoceras sorbifolium]
MKIIKSSKLQNNSISSNSNQINFIKTQNQINFINHLLKVPRLLLVDRISSLLFSFLFLFFCSVFFFIFLHCFCTSSLLGRPLSSLLLSLFFLLLFSAFLLLLRSAELSLSSSRLSLFYFAGFLGI